MSKPKLVLLFVDGLDYRFVVRNYHHSGFLSTLVEREHIFRIEGNCHSIECLADVLLGQKLDVFEFEGYASLPTDDTSPNWDVLLQKANDEDLLWRKLNAAGSRVGLLEYLGICDSPKLQGFSITKDLSRIGLDEEYRLGSCHFPPAAGRLFNELKLRHGYPPPPTTAQPDFRPQAKGKDLEALTPEEALEIYRSCDCMARMVPRVDDYCRSLFNITRVVLTRHPVDVLMVHIGHLDCLLHLFFDFHEEEPQLMHLFDRILGHLKFQVGFDELLIYSDHGMHCADPYAAGKLLYRTHHDAKNATLAGHGPRLTSLLEDSPPADLTAVYHLALETTQ